MDVGLFVDQVFYSATETHVAWLAFFFCPDGDGSPNPDGGRLLGSAALCLLSQVCNSLLHLSICHLFLVASRRKGKFAATDQLMSHGLMVP